MKKLLRVLISIPLFLIALQTVIRIVRYFYKFPMPEFMANLIDNPLRRRIQPPDETAIRHGIRQGMRVLEVGPGNGRYTVAAARQVGPEGGIVTIDIEPRMIERVQRRAAEAGLENIDARVADVYQLPFEAASFDLSYMITVINEIPDPARAMGEIHRVLKPDGALVFSELLLDPDYPLAGKLTSLAASQGFTLHKKIGGFFYYTLIFKKL
jgi:ubiquinone/menaquinone biosynthesis C-methylase UbiE